MIETLVGNIEFNLVILMGLGIAVMMSQRSARVRNMLPHGEQDVGGERRPSLHAVDDKDVVIQAAGDVPSVLAPAEIPTERFSFLAELRFAGEVFLAAWLPTTIVRLAIVLISFQLTGEEPPQHPFFDMLEGDAGALIILLIVLNAVVMAPIVEELQYRVVILGGLSQIGLAMAGVTMSSLLFAGAHGFPDSLALVPLALALAYAYLRRRSWITVMLVHFLFNAFNMAVALIGMT